MEAVMGICGGLKSGNSCGGGQSKSWREDGQEEGVVTYAAFKLVHLRKPAGAADDNVLCADLGIGEMVAPCTPRAGYAASVTIAVDGVLVVLPINVGQDGEGCRVGLATEYAVPNAGCRGSSSQNVCPGSRAKGLHWRRGHLERGIKRRLGRRN